jgi:phospholipid transport system transporter-binding protein
VSPQSSDASVERRGPAEFAVAGSLTFGTATEVHARGLAALSRESAARIEMDCSGIVAADSAGLAVLIDWLGCVAREGRELRYRGLPDPLLALARISEVDALLQGEPASGVVR